MQLYMRFILISISIGLSTPLLAQQPALLTNTCDSTILTAAEYNKCKTDTFFTENLRWVLDYIVFLKTDLFPRYRIKRKALQVPPNLQQQLKQLRQLYDSTLAYKLTVIAKDMDKGQLYVQPKAYISSVLSLEIFKFYPDINAVLFNPTHRYLNPKSNYNKMVAMQALADNIYAMLMPALRQEITTIVVSMRKERKAFAKELMLDMLQGALAD